MQSLLKPKDIVLVSSDCHKSNPYSVLLSGAHPIFLETFPLQQYDMYGAVPLKQIKTIMLDLKKKGKLHLLKLAILTNSTFDGLIYNAERFMMDILAIKPDMMFHWDEAWFAYAQFNPVYKGRTAMSVAAKLSKKLNSDAYRQEYAQWKKEFESRKKSDQQLIDEPLMPDPDQAQLRVYATQSTHKTLTSFRQGSMIHVHDEKFDSERFLEAFRMHTSTSPNYQILASLDLGRRQVSLEGYELIKNCLRLAHNLRTQLHQSERLKPYFKILEDQDLVPSQFRTVSNTSEYSFYSTIKSGWANSEFIVDPLKITMDITEIGRAHV